MILLKTPLMATRVHLTVLKTILKNRLLVALLQTFYSLDLDPRLPTFETKIFLYL